MRRSEQSAEQFAQEEFGSGRGHLARVRRWVLIGASATRNPAGTLTEVFGTDAERQGAYGQLENTAVSVEWVARSPHIACARRSREFSWVYVPVDGSSLTVTDPERTKGTGPIGVNSMCARGFNVMSAIAVSPNRTPLGVCGQQWWTRPEKSSRKRKHRRKRKLEEKESIHWLRTLEHVTNVYKAEAPTCRPWFQLDRGGDVHEILVWAAGVSGCDQLLTVRSQHDRRLIGTDDKRLWATMKAEPMRGKYSLHIPAGSRRKSRMASMHARFRKVTLGLLDRRTGRKSELDTNAIYVREVGTTPEGEKPIEWLLLTTYPVTCFADALCVVDGYATRWAIEEFHKTWKTGLCNVEDTQLRDAHVIQKWATVLASVALRAARIVRSSRAEPDRPATVEYSQDEIDAAILLRQPKGHDPGDVPTLGLVSRWIADLGGYTGKSSGGPAGQIVTTRGLVKVHAVALALRNQRRRKPRSRSD